jgi:RimJ/RimL family protein N-acetyltransferase
MAAIEPRMFSLRGGEGGASIVVRTAEPSDAAAMLEHEEHMLVSNPFKVTERGEVERTLEDQQAWIREHREAANSLALLAFTVEGQLVGKCLFRTSDRRKLRHHGTFGIDVHGDYRGQGVGSALITALLDWAAAHPEIEKVCLGTFATNAGAHRLYTRLGFRDEGRQIRYFKLGPGEYVDDIQMSIFTKPGIAPPGFETWPRR